MPTFEPAVRDDELIEEVDDLVRHWLSRASAARAQPAARLLAEVLKDPAGLEFTVGFVDRVVRPEDLKIAARNLRELAQTVPGFLPWYLRAGVKVGAAASNLAPGVVVPIARRVLRGMVRHLIVDATEARLGGAIARIRARGVKLNVNLLGEAVLGEAEASRRLAGTRRLLERPDVDYVSIKVSSPVAPHSAWAFEDAVTHITDRLLPLLQFAAASPTPKFINLDMEEYHDLDLTIEVFTALLDRPELFHLEAGIVLQAYLPDALAAMMRLQAWAASRRALGGAGIKVRLVKGANLPMERVEASLKGWPLTTWSNKQDSDTNYKRVLDYALTAERVANVRLGVAGHNLFDVAYAWVLAGRRGVRERVEFEMLLGMAEGQAEAVRETVGGLLLYVPVVHPREFDVAIAYLVRRLEEGASQDNFMSAVFELNESTALYRREKDRFLAALAGVDSEVPLPNRRQDRRTDAATPQDRFENVADTDPSLPGNRVWAAAITRRVEASRLGEELVAAHSVTEASVLDAVVADALDASTAWAAASGAQRAAVLRRAAVELERRRAELIEVMASETGKTIDQGDPEVSEAIDFANFYASLAEGLDEMDGAKAAPVRLTVVTPPWNFPLAIPAGSTLAALAAGSAVVVKPATQARRTGSVMAEALWAAGVPAEVLKLVHLDEGELGRRLVANPAVDRLILTGSFETAELFRGFRPELHLLAETSGKNAIVVTPSADLDLAVKDLVQSAFGHAGQKCSAASLGILVGSVASSRRFRQQLVDAVTSLKVGYPSDATVQMGPIIEPASGKLAQALTRLDAGETWLVEPKQLDDTGRLWSPGVKTGVKRGSAYHLVEYFGPVLGLIEASDLGEAITIQNQVDYGLTAGLHSLDRAEIEQWLGAVQAGNVYVNRGVTGAIVRRQPFGGWKKSAVGAGTKAGGPNYLIGLSDWAPAAAQQVAPVSPRLAELLDAAAAAGLPAAQLAGLRRAAGSDAAAWHDEFGVARDVSGLLAERNLLRYVPADATVRFGGGDVTPLLRVVLAGHRAGAPVVVSAATPFAEPVDALLREARAAVVIQDQEAWSSLLRGGAAPERVRLVNVGRAQFAADSGGRPDIACYSAPVVEAGRIELLTFLREQAISITAHRFGSPTPLVDGLL